MLSVLLSGLPENAAVTGNLKLKMLGMQQEQNGLYLLFHKHQNYFFI